MVLSYFSAFQSVKILDTFFYLAYTTRFYKEGTVMKTLVLFLLCFALMAETPEKKANTLTVIGFGDNNHEREVIFVFMARNGLTLLGQNRINAGSKVAGGSIGGGWTFAIKGFRQITIATAAFSYMPEADYDGRIVLYSISNWKTRYFQLGNTAKLSFPTRETSVFGGRYMQNFTGTKEAHRLVRGIGIGMESLRTNSGGGKWIEFRLGPTINLGNQLGKKGFWSRVTIFPYRDFCRPQPGKPQIWDIRVQYAQTFGLGR
jgi:hypothetical protein